jgi:ABC-type hemin transport system ATPase subunit
MSDLVIDKKTVYKITYQDKVIEISKPTVRQNIEHQRKVNKLTDDLEKFEAVLDLLHSLGLDKQISDNLDIDQLTQILDAILPKDKKK